MTLSQVLMGGGLALLVYALFSTLLRSAGARRGAGSDVFPGCRNAGHPFFTRRLVAFTGGVGVRLAPFRLAVILSGRVTSSAGRVQS